jgi:hypothetical protein
LAVSTPKGWFFFIPRSYGAVSLMAHSTAKIIPTPFGVVRLINGCDQTGEAPGGDALCLGMESNHYFKIFSLTLSPLSYQSYLNEAPPASLAGDSVTTPRPTKGGAWRGWWTPAL